MRRQALPFISRWMEGRDASDTKVLDVASGTGRFLTFVRDNWPELDCTAVELSPHYLDAVRKSNERFDDRTCTLNPARLNWWRPTARRCPSR